MDESKAVLVGMAIVAIFLGFVFFGAVMYNHGRDLDYNKFVVEHCQTVNKVTDTSVNTTKYECGK